MGMNWIGLYGIELNRLYLHWFELFELEFVDFDVAYSDLLVGIIYERFVETALEVVFISSRQNLFIVTVLIV